MFKRCLSWLLFILIYAGSAYAADDVEFFREYIEPLLKQHCYECHSHSSGEASGGLVLDSRAGWTVGGDTGAAIVPGQPDESLLWKALLYEDESLQMPPEGKLAEEKLDLIRKWIETGAADPRVDGQAALRKSIDLEAGREWWAFQPLAELRFDGSLSDQIDRRIAAKLGDHNLPMADEAAPAVLLRRICFDLTGLPPSDEDVQHFVSADVDQREQALEDTVDRLLASPQFGEKWGRHWLDSARYADSNGSSFNPPFRQAWRYRNWVIDSHNRNLPIDEFFRKQLAGDLLPYETQRERDENLIATGYLMLGSKVLGLFDKEQLTLDVVDEQLDTIGKSMLGMTLGCARCHDHKFDPIPQADYYALAGILASTVTLQDRLGGPKEDESDWSRRGLGPDGDEQLQTFLAKHRYDWIKATQKRDQTEKKLRELRKRLPTGEAGDVATRQELAQLEKESQQAETRLRELESRMPPYAMAIQDSRTPGDIPLRIRGVPSSHGETIPRGFLQVVSWSEQPRVTAASSGRLELAEWMTSSNNPVTPRVFVNRVWKHLFREGLVRSVDNFGSTGELPTHPELLDDLATWFVAHNWQLKPLIREIVLSGAYRMASGTGPESDPENRLLSCQNRRRLEPEEIRDTLLLLSGQLDLRPRQGMIDHLPIGDISNLGETLEIGDQRRTVYQPVFRTLESEVLQIFDAPNNSMTTGARPRTIVAPQALYFLNSPFVQRSAEQLADRLYAAIQPSELNSPVHSELLARSVRQAFVTICGRPPTLPEQSVLVSYLQEQADGPPGLTRHDLQKLCQTILASTQFQFLE